MKSARNQLILLGFLAQGLSWDEYFLPLINALLWVGCLLWRRRPIRFGPVTESVILAAGCAAGYLLAAGMGRSTHFFIGHGLVLMQAVRLLRPLDRREKVFSILIACFHLGVGCTLAPDFRFMAVLLAAMILVPKSLLDLERKAFAGGVPVFKLRSVMGAFAGVSGITILVFLAFPRIFVGAPIQLRAGTSDHGTLLDSVLDPARSGYAQSDRTLLQIEGERLGPLRCYALADFNGLQWSAEKRTTLRRIQYVSPEQLTGHPYRRVRAKQVGFLGRILPTDGPVVALSGRFFRRPLQNAHGAIECEAMWNTANNLYEYWTDPKPRFDRLTRAQAQFYTYHPPQSERLQNWLAGVLAGVTNSLEQARRLEARLQTNFKYQLGGPELQRLNPIDDFIFNQKQGHCERFAASLALLLRMEGVPSRIVIGYLPVNRNRYSGWYNIRFKDAHAWTEGYFPEVGWVQFDATPGGAVEAGGWNLRDLLDTLDFAWYSHVVNFDGSAQKQLVISSLRSLEQSAAWARRESPWLLAVVLAALSAWVWQQRQNRDKVHITRSRPKTAVQAAHYYGQMLRALARQGFHRASPQTPLEFLSDLQGRALPHLSEVRFITEVFCSTRYGHHPLSAMEEAEIEKALERIRKGSATGAT